MTTIFFFNAKDLVVSQNQNFKKATSFFNILNLFHICSWPLPVLTGDSKQIHKGPYQLSKHPQIIWDMGAKTRLDWTHLRIGSHKLLDTRGRALDTPESK